MMRRRVTRSELLRAICNQLLSDRLVREQGPGSRAARTRLVELVRRASATQVKHPRFGRQRPAAEAPSRLDGWLH